MGTPTNNDRPTFRLTLQATPMVDDLGRPVPPIQRLRRLLKFALRVCGLRCVRHEEVKAAEEVQK
jgi:hypothetical protein